MSKIIGIIGAMDIEVDGIVSSMKKVKTKTISGIKFYSGKLFKKDVVVAKCGIGKVFAAICAQTMFLLFSFIFNILYFLREILPFQPKSYICRTFLKKTS